MAQNTVKQQYYERFSASQRFEHMVLLVTFAGLAITGIPQRYATADWSRFIIGAMGGIESVRFIHRVLATLLMAESIYHGGVLTYKIFVLGQRAIMIPTIKDAKDVIQWILFNLGLRKEHPHLPRYNFGEKAEYLAVVWGTVVMVITGFMMWNPIATAEFLPGGLIPAAKAAHSGEALLAVLSIITWHMYNVHFKRFNKSMFTGKLSREEMLEEHGEELDDIESGKVKIQVPAEVIAKRKRVFWPYAIIVAVVLVAGLFYFVTFEETSIDTIPPSEIVVFAPDNLLDIEGDPQLGAAVWSTQRCAFCHGENAQGTTTAPALKGTDLTVVEFFRQVRRGGGEMPAFRKGDIPNPYILHIWTWLTEENNS